MSGGKMLKLKCMKEMVRYFFDKPPSIFLSQAVQAWEDTLRFLCFLLL